MSTHRILLFFMKDVRHSRKNTRPKLPFVARPNIIQHKFCHCGQKLKSLVVEDMRRLVPDMGKMCVVCNIVWPYSSRTEWINYCDNTDAHKAPMEWCESCIPTTSMIAPTTQERQNKEKRKKKMPYEQLLLARLAGNLFHTTWRNVWAQQWVADLKVCT